MIGRNRHAVTADQSGVLPLAYHHLVEIDRFYRSRKMEIYLLPAMSGSSPDADALLEDLDTLSQFAERILSSLRTLLASTQTSTHPNTDTYTDTDTDQPTNQSTPATFSAIAQYCDTLTERLRKQEQQLLPLADRLLSADDWFSIGAQFLSDDEESYRHHRAPLPMVPQFVDAV